MLLLLAFSAAAAQPLAGRMYGPTGPYPGTPGPYPARYAYAYAPQRSFIPSQDQFDLYVANEEVRSDQIARKGNAAAYNVDLLTVLPSTTTLPAGNADLILRFGSATKAAANYVTEQTIQDKIDYFRATRKGPLTQEDRNTLDDLNLQLEAIQNQKNRRTAAALPGTIGAFTTNGARFSSYFERKAHDADLTLAQNRLVDARKDFAQDPSQENRIDLINARDTEEQARDKRDANTFDLLGSTVGYAQVAGPMLRKRASATQVEVGERNLRVARLAYAQDPSQDNLDELRLASLFVQASEDDDDANSKDLLTSTILSRVGAGTASADQNNLNIWSTVMSARINDFQSRKWLRYSKLKRQILERKIAQKSSGASSTSATAAAPGPDAVVAQRLVAMSMYGRPAAVAPRPPVAL